MITNQRICITGGSGSLGQALTRRFSTGNHVVVFGRSEQEHFLMQQSVGTKNISYVIGDIRDERSLLRAMKGANIVIHAAAMLDVIMCEAQPSEAIKNNVEGTMRVIAACQTAGVEKAIAISTDKAATPSNVYGMTKYIMEKLFVEANGIGSTQFLSTRFGNMIDSERSLIEYWRQHPTLEIRLTHPDMERFFFRVADAVNTVVATLERAAPGEIFIPKMKKAKIIDILRVITKKQDFEIIGLFPGEKIHEELIGESERHYAFDERDFYVLRPGHVNPAPLPAFSTKHAESYSPEDLHTLLQIEARI